MIAKMKPVEEGGVAARDRLQRLAAVHRRRRAPASREIRRWIIENDWLEAIVALPDQLFYNTGISTYIWIVTNRKRAERRGQGAAHRRPRAVGEDAQEPRREAQAAPRARIAEITRLVRRTSRRRRESRSFANEAFGFRRVTVERPAAVRCEVTEAPSTRLRTTKPRKLLVGEAVRRIRRASARRSSAGTDRSTRRLGRPTSADPTADQREGHARSRRRGGAGSGAGDEGAWRSGAARVRTRRRHLSRASGVPEVPDPDAARPREHAARRGRSRHYIAREVLPHVPDAWVDDVEDQGRLRDPAHPYFYRYIRRGRSPRSTPRSSGSKRRSRAAREVTDVTTWRPSLKLASRSPHGCASRRREALDGATPACKYPSLTDCDDPVAHAGRRCGNCAMNGRASISEPRADQRARRSRTVLPWRTPRARSSCAYGVGRRSVRDVGCDMAISQDYRDLDLHARC